ncbi:MAG: RNA polymerase sigma factor [Phycisphaerae bacterium]|nr:RNA polymerase sigma factor [Phycisphaerae bacterium]
MASNEGDRLRRATGGDEKALVELLEQHDAQLRHRLAGKIPERWQSILSEEDVLQQTYCDAFVDIGSLRGRTHAAFVAWLLTLADRNLLDAIRMLETDKRGGNWHRIEPSADCDTFVTLFEYLGGTSKTPSRQAAREEAKAALEKALRSLPEAHRRVVMMYEIGGRSLEEVAKALDRTTGAAWMMRCRALRRLAEMMGTASKFLTGST